jgi:hypothetical protein
MMRRVLLWLALVALFGLSVALLIWCPSRSFGLRVRSTMRTVELGVAILTAAVGALVVRRCILWPDRASLGSPGALLGSFRAMSPQVAAQCSKLDFQRGGPVEYWPCAIMLASGTTIPRCVLIEEAEFVRRWRGQRVPRPGVRIEFVTAIEKSPYQLPEPILARFHEAVTRSGADHRFMRFVFKDGRNVVIKADEFPAIPELPMGLEAIDVLDVIPEMHAHGPIHESGSATLCVFKRADVSSG